MNYSYRIGDKVTLRGHEGYSVVTGIQVTDRDIIYVVERPVFSSPPTILDRYNAVSEELAPYYGTTYATPEVVEVDEMAGRIEEVEGELSRARDIIRDMRNKLDEYSEAKFEKLLFVTETENAELRAEIAELKAQVGLAKRQGGREWISHLWLKANQGDPRPHISTGWLRRTVARMLDGVECVDLY